MSEEKELVSRVFAIYGVFPEVGAYATAKYSRSSQSMAESLRELSEQKAAEFLETFYFQYGHRSIADLAHISVALENYSIAHAIVAWDEQLVDGQEGSTRYRNFRRSKYLVPPEIDDHALSKDFRETADKLFLTYNSLRAPIAKYLGEKYGADQAKLEYGEEFVERSLNARAFDKTRYLLPLATRTNLGIIASARTWERTIVRMASSPERWKRDFGSDIRRALGETTVYNLAWEKFDLLLNDLPDFPGKDEWVEKAAKIVGRDLIAAPTLVKYTSSSEYQETLYGKSLKEVAQYYLKDRKPENDRSTTLYHNIHPVIEAAATALYRGSNHSFGQVLRVVQGLSSEEISKIIELMTATRGNHDSLAKEAGAGHSLIYDISMDIGGARDMRRHRRDPQIWQDFTDMGYDIPEDIVGAGVEEQYKESMEQAIDLFKVIEREIPGYGQFILPLGARCRFLMKMDTWQADYVQALRSGVAGHESYREVAVRMYEEEAKVYPDLTRHTKITPLDHQSFWKR